MVYTADDMAKFSVGQVIHNTLLDYRGVIIDVDPLFRGTHGSSSIANPTPSRGTTSGDNGPWYHVLVDGTSDWAYVAERNLELDVEGGPIDHPDVIDYFDKITESGYSPHRNIIN
ncbi:MAG: heat shock protein HspQ [Rhodospirillaceae bacterium]|nr:heat shock protein HspQ [Rhodospirillaceae bacterium]